MVSEMMLHLNGHAATPKFSIRANNAMSLFGRLAKDWTTDSEVG
jgi:hypothetical protein